MLIYISLSEFGVFIKGLVVQNKPLYRLDENDSKDYLSDYHRRKTMRINEQYSLIINDKYLFSELFQNLTPKVLGRVVKSKVYIDNGNPSVETLLQLVKKSKILLRKSIEVAVGKEFLDFYTKTRNII